MSRVITVSRNFPAYHPKKGLSTNFPFAIWKSLIDSGMKDLWNPYISNYRGVFGQELPDFDTITPKHHTIRAGNRHRVGDKISLRTWGNDINPKSGRSGPYHSKQIILCPDIEVKRVWDFGITAINRDLPGDYEAYFRINYKAFYLNSLGTDTFREVAKNDGLLFPDFLNWFQYPEEFTGQIICWNENINY
ncbi:hypothetical protein UFOVP916_1 [uncultured Caudovirales phage]|uniref:Uncharacterized protein n=1 Tax=uncultured Caudovirales phage TaxID=2100421 RepID=A0A6J5SRM9_9CAUD|nr:hypothetical protein UFOVP827_22 [uncultured Caudovirales phage]CAB4171410.1 hypothetical protein UFOVP916_1 [uncultured Caudovirales phage]CAB4177343.1 hypothetical protein UFOVP1001_25 [uncultured Caudovirales phage]CAB4199504.1 hypothetical protein UFOVP1338_51 [uncultured Caudovirales phage]CAB4213509.1 hypothetical protein UFOVP1447_46 [uncultured Caudovirales phage]